MRELLTATGIIVVLGLGAWCLGSLLLRVAALWCFVGAGVLLLVVGQGDVSARAGPALLGWGAACWTLAHCLHRLRRAWWRSPLAARLFCGRLPRRRPRRPAAFTAAPARAEGDPVRPARSPRRAARSPR